MPLTEEEQAIITRLERAVSELDRTELEPAISVRVFVRLVRWWANTRDDLANLTDAGQALQQRVANLEQAGLNFNNRLKALEDRVTALESQIPPG